VRVSGGLAALYHALRGKGPVLPAREAVMTPPRALGMAAVVRNEAAYLPEWIEFHARLGVERFFLYDNGSTDSTAEILASYQASGLVVVIPWRAFDAFSNAQLEAYAHAIANFGPSCRWIGFFDVDEFVFPLDGNSLPNFLAPRVHLPALGVTGIFFGTSGHLEAPNGTITENYTNGVPLDVQKRFPKLLNIKCFVQPSEVFSARSAHYFNLIGTRAVAYSEHGEPLYHFPRRRPDALTCDFIRYNHYFTRSRSEFEAKRDRPTFRGRRVNSPETRSYLFDVIEQYAVPDTAIDSARQFPARGIASGDAAP